MKQLYTVVVLSISFYIKAMEQSVVLETYFGTDIVAALEESQFSEQELPIFVLFDKTQNGNARDNNGQQYTFLGSICQNQNTFSKIELKKNRLEKLNYIVSEKTIPIKQSSAGYRFTRFVLFDAKKQEDCNNFRRTFLREFIAKSIAHQVKREHPYNKMGVFKKADNGYCLLVGSLESLTNTDISYLTQNKYVICENSKSMESSEQYYQQGYVILLGSTNEGRAQKLEQLIWHTKKGTNATSIDPVDLMDEELYRMNLEWNDLGN